MDPSRSGRSFYVGATCTTESLSSLLRARANEFPRESRMCPKLRRSRPKARAQSRARITSASHRAARRCHAYREDHRSRPLDEHPFELAQKCRYVLRRTEPRTIELDDRIHHELPRTVIGQVASPLALAKRNRWRKWCRKRNRALARLAHPLKSSPARNDGLMFQKQHRIRNRISSPELDKLLLKLGCVRIRCQIFQ